MPQTNRNHDEVAAMLAATKQRLDLFLQRLSRQFAGLLSNRN